jgi:hypothetical protein
VPPAKPREDREQAFEDAGDDYVNRRVRRK